MNTNIVAGTIPEKLRNRRQWKPSEGKNAGNGWNIAANLHTYDKAVELAKRAGFSGVVFINLESDPLTILDLDKCRDPETGHIQPWAQTIIERLDSYTEISSSGSGIHIILEGEKPGERVRTGAFPGLEMYHKNRPVVVTGNRLNDKEIEPRQAEIENLYHEVFPEPERLAADVEPTGLSDDEVRAWAFERDPNAVKFRTVATGEWGEHYTSKSEADYGLASKLLFYSGDADQVERIMRGSGLYGAKWDSMRGPVTYLRHTIDNALEVLSEVYTPCSDLQVNVGTGHSGTPRRDTPRGLGGWVDLAAVAAGGIKPTPQLVPNQVYAGMVHLIHSKPGVGKTLLAIHQTRIALDAGHTVMYLDAENGPKTVVERAQLLGIHDFSRLHYNPNPEPSLDPQWVESLLYDVDRIEPAIVFIDSFADFLAGCGLDENSSMDVTRFYSQILQPLRNRGIAVVILDHEPWESRGHARGSTAKLAKMDVEWELRQTQPFNRELVGELTLNLKKDRTAELTDRIIKYSVGGPSLKFEQSAGTVTEEGLTLASKSVQNTVKAIKGFGAAGATDSEWLAATDALGTRHSAYYNAKAALLRSGKVVKNNDTKRFIYSNFAGGVTAPEELQFAGGVGSTVPGKNPITKPESNSGGVKVEYTGAASTVLHSTPGGLVPRSSGVEVECGNNGVPDPAAVDANFAAQNPDLWRFVQALPPEILDPLQADVEEFRERYGPRYRISTPQQLMYTYLRDGYAKPMFRIKDGERVLVGLVAA